MRRLAAPALAAALTVLAPAPARAVSLREVALEIVAEADGLARTGRAEEAIRRYFEAATIDQGCGEAYVGLGEARARAGDLDEALKAFAIALALQPGLGRAHAGRARVLRARGARDEARRELEVWAGAGGGEDALRELARWCGEDGAQAAQLAAWRRLLGAIRARGGDATPEAREAETMVRALVVLVGLADPAAAPAHDDPVRRGIARVARRAGGG